MNRTLLAALALTALVAVVGVLLPWLVAGDRYTTRLEVVATVGGQGPVAATACGHGRGYVRPFAGVYFVLQGDAPRVFVDTDPAGAPVGIRVEVAGRENAVVAAADCARATGAVAGNGRTAHKVEGVDGQLDVACRLPDGGPLRLAGRFTNCFRP